MICLIFIYCSVRIIQNKTICSGRCINHTLFLGTIRSNIDPSGKYSDSEIWSAIENVNLKNLFPTLDVHITENGSNFSSGQKQLVCLARALMTKNKIIVLDEATSSMDPETCKLLQTTVRKNFYTCTIITIAHRLSTILESDKVGLFG